VLNQFVAAHDQRGTLSQPQEQALIGFATRLGRERFGEYRQRVGAFSAIPKLSKGEAHRLIAVIVADLERGNDDVAPGS